MNTSPNCCAESPIAVSGVGCSIILSSTNISSGNVGSDFSDIHVPRSVIENLRLVTSLAQIRGDAFKYGVLSRNRVPGALLYGLPGTGKTLLAKSLSRQSSHTMLEVTSADLNQMYVGEGEKIVRAIFTLARKLRPCIVFIDEADAIFSSRTTSDRKHERALTNQFLREWDGMATGDSDAAFLLLATNRPFDIDAAVLRRVPLRILIDLPTCDDRLAILKILLKDEILGLDAKLPTLAESTDSYTGSDLKNLCVTAALTCVAEESPDPTTNQYLSRRVLRKKHFDQAMEVIRATTNSPSMLSQMKTFDKKTRN